MPEVKQGLHVRWKLYGRVTADAAEEPITRGQCMSAVTVACTTTLVARIFMSCRITRMRIWQVDSSATDPLGAAQSIYNPSVSWAADAGPLVKTLRPQLGTTPGYVDSKPPKYSLTNFWCMSGTDENDVLFYYNALSGAVVLLEMEAWINDSSVSPVTGVTSGKVVGSVYYALGSKIMFDNMN